MKVAPSRYCGTVLSAPGRTPDNPAVRIARRLGKGVGALSFVTPSHVYNPLAYAWPMHREYLRRFGFGQGRVLLVGMNPGPWGMAQTGVPFGAISMARDWLGIVGKLRPPLPVQHPKYPITGFDCTRSEGSGGRLWGWAQQRFGSADAFFADCFVWNYCPLLFIGQNRNLVPEKLTRAEAEPLLAACDEALAAVIQTLQPRVVFGIGRWAEARVRNVVGESVAVAYLHHPSPANPAANRNWPAMADAALAPWLG